MKRGHRLSSIEGFPGEVSRSLARLSISTAEEFLAYAALEGPNLRDALEIDQAPYDEAVDLAEDAVGPEGVERAASLADAETDDHGLGALEPISPEFEAFRGQSGTEASH